MKRFLLYLFFATQWAYCAPLTEDDRAELTYIIGAMKTAGDELTAKLQNAQAANAELKATAARQDRSLEAALAGQVIAQAAQLEALRQNVEVQKGIAADKTEIARLTKKAAKLTAEVDEQAAWKWRWFAVWLGTVALVAAFFVLRQYVPALKLL